MAGTPIFGTNASGQINGSLGDSYGPTLYVNTTNAGSGNGRSPKWEQNFATDQAVFGVPS